MAEPLDINGKALSVGDRCVFVKPSRPRDRDELEMVGKIVTVRKFCTEDEARQSFGAQLIRNVRIDDGKSEDADLATNGWTWTAWVGSIQLAKV